MTQAVETTTREELLNRVAELEEKNRRLEEALTYLTDAARDVMGAMNGGHNPITRHQVTALRNAVVWAGALSRQRET